MFVKILISASVLILLSTVVLAVKYYKQKGWPLCSAFGKYSKDYQCVVCGAETVDDCAKDSHSSK